MSNVTLKKLRPLIANDQFFRRHSVSQALKTLWIAREEEEAKLLAYDLINQALSLGQIEIIENQTANGNGGKRYYRFIEVLL
jgi:hypothetical protein